MTGRRTIAVLVGSTLIVLAGFTLLWSAVTTSTARLSASTSGSGVFNAGTVELAQPDTTVSLLFDASGLYPGRVLSSCVSLRYEGSLPADVRLHASLSGGTGLEEHVELRLSTRTTGTCPSDDGVDDGSIVTGPGQPVFAGLLGDLWRAHPGYEDGLTLIAGAGNGDRLVLDAEIEMTGGDEAQGLTTEFSVVIEARP